MIPKWHCEHIEKHSTREAEGQKQLEICVKRSNRSGTTFWAHHRRRENDKSPQTKKPWNSLHQMDDAHRAHREYSEKRSTREAVGQKPLEICVKRGSRLRAILCKGDAGCGAKERNAKNIEKHKENEGFGAEVVKNVMKSAGRFMRKKLQQQ